MARSYFGFGLGATTSMARSNAAPDSSASRFFAVSKKRADCAGSVVGMRFRFGFDGDFRFAATPGFLPLSS
jgi:hypothetical protein